MSRITEHEASQLFEGTVTDLDTPEHYLIELDVFHQLHCLNDIRRAFYPDRFVGMHELNDDGSINYDTIAFKHWGTLSQFILESFKLNS